MFIKWSDQLLTGNEIIDKQHKEIFDRAAQITQSEKTGKIESEAIGVIEYLEEYCERHFADEEALQIKCRYPGYEAHKEMHENFREKLAELKHRYVVYGATNKLAVEAIVFMLEWLANHINKSDKVLATYIQNTQSSKLTSVSRSANS